MTNILISLRDFTLALFIGVLIPTTVYYGLDMVYPAPKYSAEQDNEKYAEKRARVIFYSGVAIAAALILASLVVPHTLFSAAFNISAVFLILSRLWIIASYVSSQEIFAVMILVLVFVLGVSYRFARMR